MKQRLLALVMPAVLVLFAAGLLYAGNVGGDPAATDAAAGASASAAPSGGAGSSPAASTGPGSQPSLGPGDTPAPPTDDPTDGAVALGNFIPGAASDPTKIDDFAKLVGTPPAIVMWYQRWSGEWTGFAPRIADAIRARGATPMISWEPSAGPVNDPTWSLARIVDGTHDKYIKRWVQDVATWGHTLYVRPMYEMNGWWAPWCAFANGNTAHEYVAAWRHIVDLARAAGATNIRWVWSPNVDNDGLGVPFVDVYPGDEYVDWVGLDGFNRGTSWSSTHWQSVVQIFKVSIGHVRTLTQKPIMIGETGSSEVGGDKAAWILKSFADLPKDLPDVRAVIWFNKDETSVGIDWRVNSSAASLQAYRQVAASPLFGGRLP